MVGWLPYAKVRIDDPAFHSASISTLCMIQAEQQRTDDCLTSARTVGNWYPCACVCVCKFISVYRRHLAHMRSRFITLSSLAYAPCLTENVKNDSNNGRAPRTGLSGKENENKRAHTHKPAAQRNTFSSVFLDPVNQSGSAAAHMPLPLCVCGAAGVEMRAVRLTRLSPPPRRLKNDDYLYIYAHTTHHVAVDSFIIDTDVSIGKYLCTDISETSQRKVLAVKLSQQWGNDNTFCMHFDRLQAHLLMLWNVSLGFLSINSTRTHSNSN